jgi:penicillin-binding protein 2
MIEKYIKGYITRTDLEDWILTHSLEDEYKKPYSGQPFGINKASALQVIPLNESLRSKKEPNIK